MPGADHPTSAPPQRWQVWSALGAVYVIWGSTYLAIRVMVRTVPPLLGAGLRFVVAGAILLAVMRLRPGGRARTRVTGRQVAASALAGSLLAAGGNGLLTLAEKDVPSALAALLVASVPLWVTVLRATVGRERVAHATVAGVGLGFAGVAVLLLPGARPGDVPLSGVLLVLLAAGSWATGSFLSPRLPLHPDSLVSVGVQLACGGAVLVAAGLAAAEGPQLHPSQISGEGFAAFAYLVVPGSIVAYSAYSWLLRNVPISQVATYAYVNPLVAVVLGAAILDEAIAPATALGALLIVASVAAVIRREAPRATPPRVLSAQPET